MIWTKIKSGFKASKSVFSLVSVLLLSLALSLSHYSPASAFSLSGAQPASISAVESNISVVNRTNYTGGTQFQLSTTSANQSLLLRLVFSQQIPAYSLIHISASIKGGATDFTPLCFTGGYGWEILECNRTGDNGNYSISATGITTGARDSINLYNYVPNGNLFNMATVKIADPFYVTISDRGLSDSDISDIRFRLSQIDQWTFDGAVRLETIIPMIQDIIDAQDDMADAQQATNDKLDRQYNQDQQDRQDAQQQVEDAQASADGISDDYNDASASLLSTMGTIVGLIRDTPATNCSISVNDIGQDGVLDLGNVNLCSVPNEVKQLINNVFGMVMIVASALLALNVFHAGLDLMSQALGYGYNIPKGVD